MQKTYLSRAMTRAMSLDHPIGDPTGGPAYGERNDPVSAIVAISTMAASYGGAAALMAGTISFATVAAGVAFVGGAMSLVGNATGDRNLMKYGSTASLIGGLGMAGANFFSSADIAKGAVDSSGWVSGESLPTGDMGVGAATSAPSVAGEVLDDAANAQAMVNAPAPQAAPAAQIPAGGGDVGANMDALYGGAGMDVPAAVAPDAGVGQGLAGGAGSTAGNTAGGVAGADAGTVAGQQNGLLSSGFKTFDGSATGTASNGWSYFTDPATGKAVAISPEQQYFSNGMGDSAMRQVTGAGGGQMTMPEQFRQLGWDAKNAISDLAPDTSKMSTMDKFLAMKIVGDTVGGVTSYVAPSDQQKAQTEAMRAQAEANKAQAEKIRADEELRQKRLAQLRQNMAMGVNMGRVNQGAVSVNAPGLINAARPA